MNKRKIWRSVLLVLIILTVLFIFSHSVVAKSTSLQQSGWVRTWLQSGLDALHIPLNLTSHLVRKIAHFVEFFILGAELTCYRMCGRKLGRQDITGVLCTVFAVAFADETIQIFSARGPAIADVWLDVLGGAVAMLVVFAIHYLALALRKK